MKKITLISAAALIAAASSLPAMAEGAEGKVDPSKEKTLQTQLSAQGYEVRRMEMEDGLIEVYALKDGKRMEMYFDNKTLKQVQHKSDGN